MDSSEFTAAAQAEPVLSQCQAGSRFPASPREIIPEGGNRSRRGPVARDMQTQTLSRPSGGQGSTVGRRLYT